MQKVAYSENITSKAGKRIYGRTLMMAFKPLIFFISFRNPVSLPKRGKTTSFRIPSVMRLYYSAGMDGMGGMRRRFLTVGRRDDALPFKLFEKRRRKELSRLKRVDDDRKATDGISCPVSFRLMMRSQVLKRKQNIAIASHRSVS